MLCDTVQTYTTYTTIITTITTRLLFLSAYNIFVSQRRFPKTDYFVHTQLYTMLTEFLLLTVLCFVLPFYNAHLMKVLEVERSGFRLLKNSFAMLQQLLFCFSLSFAIVTIRFLSYAVL